MHFLLLFVLLHKPHDQVSEVEPTSKKGVRSSRQAVGNGCSRTLITDPTHTHNNNARIQHTRPSPTDYLRLLGLGLLRIRSQCERTLACPTTHFASAAGLDHWWPIRRCWPRSQAARHPPTHLEELYRAPWRISTSPSSGRKASGTYKWCHLQ
jgi:hypothetical protein